MCAHMWVHMCACVWACTHVPTLMCALMSVCRYVCACMHMHVHAHTTHCTLKPCVTFCLSGCWGDCHQEQPESRASREQERTGGGAGSKSLGPGNWRLPLTYGFLVRQPQWFHLTPGVPNKDDRWTQAQGEGAGNTIHPSSSWHESFPPQPLDLKCSFCDSTVDRWAGLCRVLRAECFSGILKHPPRGQGLPPSCTCSSLHTAWAGTQAFLPCPLIAQLIITDIF